MKRAFFVLVCVLAGSATERARACGCFTPPAPDVPIVQAGEKIIFRVTGGQVTAQIQIQYSGDARDFGWLLPLPSVPTLELGSDEVFADLMTVTAPHYPVEYRYDDACLKAPPAVDLGAGFAGDLGMANGGGGPNGPLVLQDSIGPYDYAVLKADSKQDMLDWLAKNRYFVPVGTNDVVGPYIHPGAYFLALRLQSGKSTGDLQPVVVHYASDLPMIPIVLTSATATPDMSVWVWLLGDARAIPRNYFHVVLDDAAFDGWGQDRGVPRNYEQLVSRAVRETANHHAFVTEFAQPTKTVKGTLFPPAQFGDLVALRKLTGAGDYLRYLRVNGFVFTSNLVAILQRYIKQPQGLKPQGGFGPPPSATNYYYNFDYWKMWNQMIFQSFDLTFDPVALTDEIEAKIVKPVHAAAMLFDGAPYLTRLHTRLSPEEMTSDPVFSFNPFLPDVSPVHPAVFQIHCDNPQNLWQRDATLHTDEGFAVDYPGLGTPPLMARLPGALRIEILREDGLPEIAVDNLAAIRAALGMPPPDMAVATVDLGNGGNHEQPMVQTSACSAAPGGTTSGAGLMVMFALVLLGLARRRK